MCYVDIESTRCPHCGEILDCALRVDGGPPVDFQEDDVMICSFCNYFLKFTADGTFVEMTEEEETAIPPMFKAAMYLSVLGMVPLRTKQ
jgi:hypothetical protein